MNLQPLCQQVWGATLWLTGHTLSNKAVVSPILFFKVFIYLYIYFERESRGGSVREEERIPRRLRAVSATPSVRLKLMNREITTRTKIKRQALNQLSHPGAPSVTHFI